MKKVLIGIIGMIWLLTALAWAADQPVTVSDHGATLKATTIKTATMNARGTVVVISDTAVTIERRIKGNSEMMELALESPAMNILVNDFVKIDYSIKDGKLTASRLVKLKSSKRPVKNGTSETKEKPVSATK
jgi:hypothetical protein